MFSVPKPDNKIIRVFAIDSRYVTYGTRCISKNFVDGLLLRFDVTRGGRLRVWFSSI
jgi:hypothetical protein